MTEATFTVPALEFTAAFFEHIRPFLQNPDIEVFVQLRKKAKKVRKNGKVPILTPPSNGATTLAPVPFVKKYPSQPTPEEAEKIIAELTARPMRETIDLDEIIQEQNWKPIGQAEWDRMVAELGIQESAEELIALLTK